MSNTQTYEGPHLEPLLAKVREAHGVSARIVSVDKVRSGGMGGFFQRERFEVAVEVDVEASGPVTGQVTGKVTGKVTEVSLPAPAHLASPLTTLDADEMTNGPVAGAASVLDLAAAIDDASISEVSMGSAAAEFVSTAQPEFEEIMARVSATLGSIPTPATPENLAAAGFGADMPADMPAGAPAAAPAPAPMPAPVAAPMPAPMSAPLPTPQMVAPAPLPTPPGPPAPPAPAPLKWSPVPEGELVVAKAVTLPTGTPTSRAGSAPAVATLGLPSALVPPSSTPQGDLRRALAQRLAMLPAAPELPREGGAVIAIVGEVDDAIAHGLRLAAELGLEDDGVVLASRNEPRTLSATRLHVRGEQDANTRRRAWYRRNLPVVVAVDAPVVPDRDTWVGDVLTALEPTLVIGAVDARRKTEDVLEWGRGFGGVDAVMLENLAATVSPGAMLGLGVPVMTLDGLPATPARWVDTLTRRLELVAA